MTTTRPCTTCGRDLHTHETGRHACTPCVARMGGWLTELPNQLIVLRASTARETVSAPTGGRTATRTAPIPGRLDVLSLTGPSAPGDVTDPHGDQHGPLPITATLGGWCRLVAEERSSPGPPAALPVGFHVRRVACGCSKPEPPSFAHCGEPITGRWVGPIPKTGRLRDPHAAPVYHLDRPACRNAPPAPTTPRSRPDDHRPP